MLRLIPTLLLLTHCLAKEPLAKAADPVKDPDPARFASEIDAFDAQDAQSPPAPRGIVFSGSSSIRLLDIPTVFPGIEALNRGFGGAHISDLNHYLDRCLLRYRPATVVFFCGTNDLWDKKSPAQVAEDFDEYRKRLFEVSPDARLIIIPVRPTPSRQSIREQEDVLNRHFAAIAGADPRVRYLPALVTRYLKPDGTADPKYFVADMLHMNASGYAIWKEVITPLLTDPEPAP